LRPRCPTNTIATIDDSAKIERVVDVLVRYPDGWRDSWNAPGGGGLNLVFYRDEQLLRTFGITSLGDEQAMLWTVVDLPTA
jgi:hypothetical protein